ncbi:MAG: hypothetical protein VKJ04_09985 [Vampirovibrionales bacterium]|nr:hypothetical protein [Vampirovibrionales bacterium]
MPKKILSVNLKLAVEGVEYIQYSSNRNLLDGDITIFCPTLPHFPKMASRPNRMTDESVSNFTKYTGHWSEQIMDAFTSGKCVCVLLTKPESVTKPSGYTSDSYAAIPFDLKLKEVSGAALKPATGVPYMAEYIESFKTELKYQCLVETNEVQPLLVTKTGEKIVGGYISNDNGGLVLFLPMLDFKRTQWDIDEVKSREEYDEELGQFSSRFLSQIVKLRQKIFSSTNETPVPEWSNGSQYRSKIETELIDEISAISSSLAKLEEQKQAVGQLLKKENSLKKLLYEQGGLLESSIVEALRILGFQAEGYHSGTSEFDVLFDSEEGMFLGEAEGKDTKAINTTKVRQLVTNSLECFELKGEHPKGVLFGNPQRLTEPKDRTETFTEKCMEIAKLYKYSLVLTAELYKAATYVKESNDMAYAKECRSLIINTESGLVLFPDPSLHKDTATNLASTKA